MKKALVLLMFVLFCASGAQAEMQPDYFNRLYRDSGLDDAVLAVVKEGVHPEAIVKDGMQIEEINPANLVKALYCAGVQGADVRDASKKNGISEAMVAAGYKKSLAECKEAFSGNDQTQAFTPVATGTGFVSVSSGDNSGNVSPSEF